MAKRYFTSESVTSGHPDKVCDLIADSILDEAIRQDPYAHMAVEATIKDDLILVYGEAGTTAKIDYEKIALGVMKKIGYNEEYHVLTKVNKQSPEINNAVAHDEISAGDQGIMYGYATNETAEFLPMPFAVATTFIQRLEELNCPMLMPDAKAQVSYDYDTDRITTFLCSVQHDADADLKSVRKVIKSLMVLVASEYGLNTDFEMLVNPTGRFVIGGSKADCGVTGRKLACDTYGGIARIGGGALSGKDPSKVDRSAAYMARKIAVDLVRAGYCDKCEIQIAYAIGKARPVSVVAETFGTAKVCPECIDRYIKANYDLTPQGIIKALHLLDVDYNLVSSGGHFGKDYLPWEMDDDELLDEIYGTKNVDRDYAEWLNKRFSEKK